METSERSEQLLNLLLQIHKKMRQNRPVTGLVFNEVVVLNILNHSEKENIETQMKDLSERMHISRPALNALINKVEEKGFVERYQKQGDRKSVYVRLTETSKQIYENQKKQITAYMNDIIHQMGIVEATQLIELLDKLYTILDN